MSLGSGACSHELDLAQYAIFDEIVCIDLSENRLSDAKEKAEKRNLKNIKFVCADFNTYPIPKDYYDIVFFHASLHHIDNVDDFLSKIVKNSLKKEGFLVIDEYVGATRLQFPKNQIKVINKALELIPKEYRKRNKSNILKSNYYGSGYLRMIIADPSECIDSENIMPAIHQHFYPIVEKPYGGNILMSALKDISHHFVPIDDHKKQILENLFDLEDEFLKNNDSDLVFGIYQKK